MAKVTREKFKTYNNVFSEWTLRNIFKLAGQGHFEELQKPIFVGKESNVFLARTRDATYVVVKIYRLESCDFKKMFSYIKYDPRYSNLKGRKREIIFAWTRRENRNLLKARELGIKVPTPYTVVDNILIEELIGNGDTPAPRLKDQEPDDIAAFYTKLRTYMRKMYQGGLVHGDLSEYNILNQHNQPVLIDFSQSTITKSVHAQELLERDCINIARYFAKRGIDVTPEKLKAYIMKK